jgi:hypothetical protein
MARTRRNMRLQELALGPSLTKSFDRVLTSMFDKSVYNLKASQYYLQAKKVITILANDSWRCHCSANGVQLVMELIAGSM